MKGIMTLGGLSLLTGTLACLCSTSAPAATSSDKFVLGFVDAQNAQSETNASAFADNMSALSISSYYWITGRGAVVSGTGAVSIDNIITTAHSKGLKVLPGLSNYANSGWNNTYAIGAIVTNKNLTIKNIVSFVTKNKYDGVEIDFEYSNLSGAPTAAQYTSFISSLAKSLHAANKQYKLVVSVPAHTSDIAAAYNYAQLAAAADYLQIMTYDEYGPGWSVPGPVASLDWMQEEFRYLIDTLRISPNKLLSGLPAYGQDYSTAKPVNWVNFANIIAAHATSKQSTGVDADAVTPWSAWGTITSSVSAKQPVLWYDNASSIEAKANLVNTYGLVGTSIWAVGMENAAFWAAINTGLGDVGTVTLTASASSGGTITPSGSLVTNVGSSKTFYITPKTGYSINGVKVDGISVGNITNYTFNDIGSAHTIAANFVIGQTNVNLADQGTGYTWKGNTSATANGNRSAQPAVNDGDLSSSVLLNTAGEKGNNRWEAAGIILPAAKTISTVSYLTGNGYFQKNCQLQFSATGTTWFDSGWTLTPNYPYTAAANNQTYSFQGRARTGIKGVRVVGQTTGSGSVVELQVMGR